MASAQDEARDYASKMLSHRRLGALLLVCGYLGVVGGSVAWVVSYWHFDAGRSETTIYQAALAIGIGLAGFACWRWTVNCRGSDTNSYLARGPTHWMAAASLVLAAAPAAETYETYDNHRQLMQSLHQLNRPAVEYPHYRLLIAGGVALTAGLVLAAVGFWILGVASEMTSASLSPIASTAPALAVVTEAEPAP